MRWGGIGVAILALALVAQGTSWGEEEVLFREEFNDLDEWKPFHFEKIQRHSSYTIVAEGPGRYRKAESDGSASAILFKGRFNVREYPKARWRWRVENVYEKGDLRTREGDDYPIRIYFIFQFDPEKVSFWDKVKYESAKLIYGEYPPDSTLNYIWSSKANAERIVTSPYTDRAKLVILESGRDRVGQWIMENVDVSEDYQRAFGRLPPAMASIAIMNDSDNTGERSASFVDFIEVYRDGPGK